MLVLTLQTGKSLVLTLPTGEVVEMLAGGLGVYPDTYRLCFRAPAHVIIDRAEIHLRRKEAQRAQSNSSASPQKAS